LIPMPDAYLVRQSLYFDRFSCIGSECEDTCCRGWGVAVDSDTWERYQSHPDFRVGDRTLGSFIEINPASSSATDYAKMKLEGV